LTSGFVVLTAPFALYATRDHVVHKDEIPREVRNKEG
jgi:hypothetical protein